MNVRKNKRVDDGDKIFLSELIKKINSERVVNDSKEKLDEVEVEIQLPTIKEEAAFEIIDGVQDPEPEAGTDNDHQENRHVDISPNELTEKQKVRLQKRREQARRYKLNRKINETIEEREQRLKERRDYYQKSKERISSLRRKPVPPEERESQLKLQREYYARKIKVKVIETPERHEHQLHVRRNRYEQTKGDNFRKMQYLFRRENETPEHRENRLSRNREYYKRTKLCAAARHFKIKQNETADERNVRKQKRREQGRKYYLFKKTIETEEEHSRRLLNRREYLRKRNLRKITGQT